MKRKYYMRGLGIGVLVTAILCAVALPKQTEPMTDEEVIARAKELGYVKEEGGVTPEDIDKIKENEKMTGTPGVSDGTDTTQTPEMTTPNATKEPDATPDATASPIPTPEPPEKPDKPEQPASPTPVERPTATTVPEKTPSPRPTETPAPTATLQPTKAPTEAPKPTNVPVVTGTPATTSYTITVERGATARRVAERLEAVGAVDDADAFVKHLQKNNLTDFINIGTFTIPKGASYGDIAWILTGR